MPLAEFQRAFAAAVADPDGWAARLAPAGGGALIGDPPLSPKERECLLLMLQSDGMQANRILLTATRAMPLRSALPLTCDWLCSEITEVLDAWVAISRDASVQYKREADRFAAWLPAFLTQAGKSLHPALDALRYERAVAALALRIGSGCPDAILDLSFAYDPDEIVAGWRSGIRALEIPIATRLCVRDDHLVLLRLAGRDEPAGVHILNPHDD